jgi:hypothetical protein
MPAVKGAKLELTCISRGSLVQELTFSPWLAARAKRLRIYRRTINAFWFLIALILALNLLRWIFPKISPLVIGAIWRPFGLAMYVWGPIWFSLGLGCMLGLFKSPSCDRQFTSKFSLVWFGRTCQNCHFDIYTLKHKPANG